MNKIVLSCSLIPVLLGAQSTRPVVGAPPSFTPPAMRTETANGLRSTLVPYGTTPTARVELVIRSGRATEPAGESGVSQLVADYVLEGTTSRSGLEIARALASIGTVGGALTISVGSHETVIAGEVLSESVSRLIALIGEVVLRPAFDSTSLDRLRSSLRRRSQVTASAAIAANKVNAILFPDDPADRIPSDTTLGVIDMNALRRFHAREYVAARAHLYVAGVFDANEVVSAARTAFANMPRGTPADPVPSTQPRRLSSDTSLAVYLINRPNATQTRIHVAFPVVDQMHPDHLVLNQLNTLMGSVQTSRIIANVRERRGYSYNISSRLIRRPGGTTWAIQGDVNRDVTGNALREILGELDRVVTEPPGVEELAAFQRFMSGGNVTEMATSRGILEYLRFLALYGEDAQRYLATLVPNVHAVKPADLVRVVRTYIRPDRRVIVLVGDAAAIEAQVSQWARIVR
jgi:predicted Zn-dependent peptidase